MAKKQTQINPNVNSIFEQFISDIEAHSDVPKETVDRLKELLSTGGKITPEAIDKVING